VKREQFRANHSNRDQGQHRLSRVYLKQFGFEDKNGHWNVSIYELGNPITKNRFIKSFTKEKNIFDVRMLAEDAPEASRYFERNSKLVEDYYPSVIRRLNLKKKVDGVMEGILTTYAANILCRTNRFRSLLLYILESNSKKAFLIDEITMFDPDRKSNYFLKSIHPSISINDHLNIIIGNVMNHLVKTFESFNLVLLKDWNENGWFSCDNPVVLDVGQKQQWLIPINTEIYFPLSRDFCLFMYHPNGQTSNTLRTHDHGTYVDADENLHKTVLDKISSNADKFLILPVEMGGLNLHGQAYAGS
jgi:hypothetical protein